MVAMERARGGRLIGPGMGLSRQVEVQMYAIVVDDAHEDKRLEWLKVDAPALKADEAAVDVHATALNRADLAQRAGNYPPPSGASEILGLEMAGTVRQLGADAKGFSVGDRVCALLTGGGYAEQVTVPTGMLMPIPQGWTLEQAAAMPEVYFTAYLNLFMEAGAKPGEAVLIHGGASGVGTAAIQLAAASGCRVYATAGTADKCRVCSELGAEIAVNYKEEDFAARLRDHTGGDGVDVILDMVGASYLQRNVNLLGTGGRIVFIATLGGPRGELDIRKLMAKRATLKGSTLRARPLAEKLRIKQELMDRFWPHFESGRIKPVIDSVYPIQEVEQAHARMAENRNIGKIVLKVR